MKNKFLVIILVSLFFSAFVSAKVEVRLHSEVVVDSDVKSLRLSDVADIQGEVEDVEYYQQQVFDRAPNVGETTFYQSKDVSLLLRRISRREGVVFKLPQSMRVENLGNQYSSKTVIRRLKQLWKQNCPKCEFQISALSIPAQPKRLVGQSWRILENGRRPKGSFSRQLQFMEDQNQKMYWVTGHVEVFHRVPVVRKNTRFQQLLKREDVEWKKKNITYSRQTPLHIEDVVGRRVRRTLAGGDVVWDRDLIREKALRRGDTVKVSTGEGHWNVSLLGHAEQDGFIGDVVKVKNLKSNKIISGRVVGKGEVSIQ